MEKDIEEEVILGFGTGWREELSPLIPYGHWAWCRRILGIPAEYYGGLLEEKDDA
jgi:hypothetical protein